jgi:hypothetical protein
VTFSLPTEIGDVELVAHGKEPPPISKTTDLVLRGPLYGSAATAERHGVRAQSALLLAGAATRIGVDFGRSAQGSWAHLTAYGREFFARRLGIADAQVLNDKFGLMVFEDSGRVAFLSMGPARLTVGVPLDRFVAALERACESVDSLGPKHLLALELFSASKFESSIRARFVTLITVLETLAVRRPKTAAARTFLVA